MTTHQHKIGSGFGADSTADDVLDGIELDGAFAIVTAHSGCSPLTAKSTS